MSISFESTAMVGVPAACDAGIALVSRGNAFDIPIHNEFTEMTTANAHVADDDYSAHLNEQPESAHAPLRRAQPKLAYSRTCAETSGSAGEGLSGIEYEDNARLPTRGEMGLLIMAIAGGVLIWVGLGFALGYGLGSA